MRKRFYKNVDVRADGDGFAVVIDGRALTTPGGNCLRLKNSKMADVIAAEWNAQTDNIDPAEMPFTGLAYTAIDRMGARRGEVIADAVGYGGTDLLCYRADFPDDLRQCQDQAWQPLVDWANDALKVKLRVTQGVSPVDQPEESMDSLRRAVEAMDDFELAALTSIAAACGSLVIAMAVAMGRLDAGEAFLISQLDEDFQSGRWGDDKDTVARKHVLSVAVNASSEFLLLCRE